MFSPNKGAPGIDGMTVEELTPYLKGTLAAHTGEMLSGRYVPAASPAGGHTEAGRKREEKAGNPDSP